MEIRQLRYFIAVADTLNFSRAAESVYLSQSALSRQIMDLEREVGLPLLRRSTRQVELTDAGRALQKSAKELISRWEKMLPEVRNQVSEDVRGLTLTIGVDARALAHPARRSAFLSKLYDMRRENPGLRVLLRNDNYQNLIKGLSDKSLDCALILDRELEPQICFCESLEDMTMTVETGESAAILPESVVEKLDDPNLQTLHLPSPHTVLTLSLLWNKNQDNPLLPTLRQRLRPILT